MRTIDILEGQFKGKTALILAAGPSLLDDIETIKKKRHGRDNILPFVDLPQTMQVL